jgi:hypothetical protein
VTFAPKLNVADYRWCHRGSTVELLVGIQYIKVMTTHQHPRVRDIIDITQNNFVLNYDAGFLGKRSSADVLAPDPNTCVDAKKTHYSHARPRPSSQVSTPSHLSWGWDELVL